MRRVACDENLLCVLCYLTFIEENSTRKNTRGYCKCCTIAARKLFDINLNGLSERCTLTQENFTVIKEYSIQHRLENYVDWENTEHNYVV